MVGALDRHFLEAIMIQPVLLAFEEVEVRARKLAGLSETKFGVNLMRDAFDPTHGAGPY